MEITRFAGKYAFLDNFYECKVTFEGVEYPTTENAFQAAKAFEPEEKKWIKHLFAKVDPGTAKGLGQSIVLRKDWETVKYEIMYELVRQKFQQPFFKTLLDMTEDWDLIEGNTWNDRCWGVCDGTGENHLGKILMRIREENREGENEQ